MKRTEYPHRTVLPYDRSTHYRTGDRIRSEIATYDGDNTFTCIGDLGTITAVLDDTYEVQLDKGARSKIFTTHQIAPEAPVRYQAGSGDVWEKYGSGYRLTHDRAVTVGWERAVSISGPLTRIAEEEVR